MLSVERIPQTFESRSSTSGVGRHVDPAETVPPSSVERTPSRLFTTTVTRTEPEPCTKKRKCQSPVAKHIAGDVAVLPLGR